MGTARNRAATRQGGHLNEMPAEERTAGPLYKLSDNKLRSMTRNRGFDDPAFAELFRRKRAYWEAKIRPPEEAAQRSEMLC